MERGGVSLGTSLMEQKPQTGLKIACAKQQGWWRKGQGPGRALLALT